MPIFKFATNTKPSALKIWTTLIDTPIHPREGYTEDQIRYRMFICLQLGNFKEILVACNIVIDSPSASLDTILSISRSLASCTEDHFSDLDVLSVLSFPHWVSSELYTPYYLTKMLCHKLNNFTLLLSLFDRKELSGKESDHWNVDQLSVDYPGLTAYKLYNSTTTDEVLQWVTLSYDRTPRPVMSKTEMHISIRDQLMQSIEVSDNHIIPENTKTTIPYFTLATTTTVPATSQTSSSPRPFVVGDRVRLRSDLVKDRSYNGTIFKDELIFEGTVTVVEIGRNKRMRLSDSIYVYHSSMLEYAEGSTNASQ